MTSQSEGDRIHLRILGGADLKKADDELTRILAQPRRFALLVYLVLARPGGFVRRDRLMAIFWSESDEDRARASLRQAIRYLRRWLGKGVVVGRGAGELGVHADRLSCDVVELRRHLDAGDDRAALALYRGPLLPGFLVSGAPAFERWLESERRRLRTAAVEAALRLADAAEEAGDPEEAAELAGRALRIDPLDEAVARRRIALLDRIGKRATAAKTYRSLASRLRREFDLTPAPETEALMAAVRSRSGAEDGGDGREGERNDARSPGPEARRVVVTRFENRTGREDLGVLGGMAADWISQGLAGIPEVVALPPVLGPGSDGGNGDDDNGDDKDGDDEDGPPEDELARVRSAAREAGAGTVVGGAYYLDGGHLRFRTRIVDAVRGTLVEGPEDVVVPETRPMDGLKELSRRVNTRLAPNLNPRAAHVRQGARPAGFEAYRAYMEGLEVFVRGRWESALVHFRRAAEAEPGYALPRIVRAIALWNLGRLEEAGEAARDAAALRDGIGRFEGAVLDNLQAWLAGDWSAAHEAARTQARIAPGSIPHFQVAEEARRLNRPREARAVLSRLDPERGELEGWIFYWIELATAHHLLGDHRRELTSARRARALHPDHPVPGLLEVRALAALGEREELTSVLDDVASLPGRRHPRPGASMLEAALELGAHGYAEDAATFHARAVSWYAARADGGSPPRLRRDFARVLYHAGEWERAEEIFRELAGDGRPGVAPVGFHHEHLQAHLDHGYLALIAAQRGDGTEVERLRRVLRELDGPFLYGAHWFWLAALDAVLGDPDRATRMLRRAFAEGLPHEMFLHTDPHLLRLRGHPRFEAIMKPRG